MSVMNSRRLTPRIGLPPAWRHRSVYRTFNLPRRGRQVLGANLNCSESRRGGRLPVSVDDAVSLHCGISIGPGLGLTPGFTLDLYRPAHLSWTSMNTGSEGTGVAELSLV